MKKLLFLIFLISFFSCKENVVVVPDEILSKDTMAAILADIQLQEAIIIQKGINDSLSKDSVLKEYALIFQKHKLSQEQFEKSFNYYKENPEMLEEIYERVINKLSEMKALISNIHSTTIDSLKNKKGNPEKQKPEKKTDIKTPRKSVNKKEANGKK